MGMVEKSRNIQETNTKTEEKFPVLILDFLSLYFFFLYLNLTHFPASITCDHSKGVHISSNEISYFL